MALLITGAAGFIGAHVARRLLERGERVIGVDNLNDYYPVQLKRDRLAALTDLPGMRFVEADLADPAALEAAAGGEDIRAMVHLAAQAGVRHSITHPLTYGAANLTGFLHVLEFSRQRRLGHLVYASSSSVYGGNVRLPFSENDPVDHPVSLYAATKKANEVMAHSYSHLYGVPTTGLRFFTVYGPWGRPDMAYFSFTRDILEGRPIQVFNEGRMLRDFTYIDDIVDGVVAALDRPATPSPDFDPMQPQPSLSSAPYRLFNIGNQDPVALGDFIAEIERATGREAVRQLMPMQPGDVTATHADVSALTAWTGVSPSTPLRSGIERFVRWYRDYYVR